MIKIERLDNGCKPTYVYNGVRQPLRLHSVISQEQFDSVEFDIGAIFYSVDELEVHLLEAAKPKSEVTKIEKLADVVSDKTTVITEQETVTKNAQPVAAVSPPAKTVVPAKTVAPKVVVTKK